MLKFATYLALWTVTGGGDVFGKVWVTLDVGRVWVGIGVDRVIKGKVSSSPEVPDVDAIIEKKRKEKKKSL